MTTKKATSVDEPRPLDLDLLAEEARDTYRTLVVAHVSGEPIDQGQLREVLVLSGKRIDTFKTDAVRLQQRYAAVKDLQSAQEMQPQLVAALELIDKLAVNVQTECTRHAAVLQDLTSQQAAAQDNHAELHRMQTKNRRDAEELLQRTADSGITTQTKRLLGQARAAAIEVASRKHPLKLEAKDDPGDWQSPVPMLPVVDQLDQAREKQMAVNVKILAANESSRDPLGGMAWNE